MDKSKYLVDGEIGKPAVVGKFGTQFEMTNRIPLVKNTVFETYAKAYNYVTTNDVTTMPGVVITVTDDLDATKNGAYVTAHDEISETNHTGLKLIKLAAGNEAQEQINWEVLTDDVEAGGTFDDEETGGTLEDPEGNGR